MIGKRFPVIHSKFETNFRRCINAAFTENVSMMLIMGILNLKKIHLQINMNDSILTFGSKSEYEDPVHTYQGIKFTGRCNDPKSINNCGISYRIEYYKQFTSCIFYLDNTGKI